MSTTIADTIENQEELSEEDRLALASLNFQAPQPNIGEVVMWYRNGKKDASPPSAMIVVKINQNARTCHLLPMGSGELLHAIRHVTDPRLKESEELRKEGAWDFSEEKYQIAELKKKVEALATGTPVEAAPSDSKAVDKLTKSLEKQSKEIEKQSKEVESLKAQIDGMASQLAKLLTSTSKK